MELKVEQVSETVEMRITMKTRPELLLVKALFSQDFLAAAEHRAGVYSGGGSHSEDVAKSIAEIDENILPEDPEDPRTRNTKKLLQMLAESVNTKAPTNRAEAKAMAANQREYIRVLRRSGIASSDDIKMLETLTSFLERITTLMPE